VLRWSFIPQPHTIYHGVRQLAPGTMLVASHDRTGRLELRHERWWSLADTLDDAIVTRPASRTMIEAADELDGLLYDAVACRMESDVPLGAFLSGGIDSSLVAVMAQRALGTTPLRTFTVKIPEPGLDESVHAERTARFLGSNHTTVELSLAEALAIIPRLPTVFDEPFADPSMLPTALLCQTARQYQTVCLAGDGGDELFAGYNRHAGGSAIWNRTRRVPAVARRTAGRALLRIPSEGYEWAARGAHRVLPRRWQLPAVGDKAHKAGALLSGEGALWESMAGIWPEQCLAASPYQPWVPSLDSALDPVEDIVLRDISSVLTDQMLVKVDRASMAASLEVRVPFVDQRLLAWSWSQPMDIKCRRGTGKLVLRELARRLLPPDVAERPKLGFDPPLARWLRTELKEWAGDLLESPGAKALPFDSQDTLRQAWDQHQSGRRNLEYQLWGALSMVEWLATYT
jgi:asparagine synthase (glutamine-hydrolysing)